MGRIKAAFRPILRRHHDESIGLVVAEPLASMVASYLRCEPRVQLEERWSCGDFELIEIAPCCCATGQPDPQPFFIRPARHARSLNPP